MSSCGKCNCGYSGRFCHLFQSVQYSLNLQTCSSQKNVKIKQEKSIVGKSRTRFEQGIMDLLTDLQKVLKLNNTYTILNMIYLSLNERANFMFYPSTLYKLFHYVVCSSRTCICVRACEECLARQCVACLLLYICMYRY